VDKKSEAPVETAPANIPSDFDKLAAAIVSATNANREKKQVPYGQHNVKSKLNPTGSRNRRLKTPVLQNGNRIDVNFIDDEAIELLSHIKPGRYLDRLVTVVQMEDDISGEKGVIDIRYRTKTADQRMAIGNRIGPEGFNGLLKMIIAEHAATEKKSKDDLLSSLTSS
jgi:hypothetical protein